MEQRKLVRIAFLSFIALGLRAGLLGVSWPSIRDTFSLSLDAVGVYLIAAMLGYLLTTSISGWVSVRIGLGRYLFLGCAIAGLGFLGQALAPAWWILVCLSFIASAGVAVIDSGLNTYFALNQSAGEMNWLHACFGLGGTLSPIIMTTAITLSGSWRWGFVPVSLAYGGLAVVFLGAREKGPSPESLTQQQDGAPASPPSSLTTLKLPAVWLGIVLFFIFTGVEGSSAQWPYTLFTEGRGVEPATASLWITIFWASMTVGRVFFGFVVELVGRDTLLLTCMSSVVLASGILWWNPGDLWNFLALAVIGFGIAPVFPVATSMTPQRVGATHAANAIGFQMAVARLGLSLIPGLVGIIADAVGLQTIPPLLFINAVLMLVLQVGISSRFSMRHERVFPG